MQTLLTDSTHEAAAIIRRGGIVAFPTETVYGLGASVFDSDAVGRVFTAKGRPSDNPLIVHVCDLEQIEQLVELVPDHARLLIDAFFPGPLTLVMKRRASVPEIVSAGLETVAVRMPANRTAIELIRSAGVPLVAPSANLSGRPSPTTWQAVIEDLDGRIDAVLRDVPCTIGIESTVVDVSTEPPMILRRGAITVDELRDVVPDILEFLSDSDRSRLSPGTRHRHYSPNAQVLIVNSSDVPLPDVEAFIGITQPSEPPELTVICESITEYAARLYEFFRECDRLGGRRIACESVEESGVGAALMDRIRRAAE